MESHGFLLFYKGLASQLPLKNRRTKGFYTFGS